MRLLLVEDICCESWKFPKLGSRTSKKKAAGLGLGYVPGAILYDAKC